LVHVWFDGQEPAVQVTSVKQPEPLPTSQSRQRCTVGFVVGQQKLEDDPSEPHCPPPVHVGVP
jgi:hypothetical protein